MNSERKLLLYEQGTIDEYSNKQVPKKREMKGKTGLRLENKRRRERRKGYVILS